MTHVLSIYKNMDVVKASHARLLEQIEELDTHLKEVSNFSMVT